MPEVKHVCGNCAFCEKEDGEPFCWLKDLYTTVDLDKKCDGRGRLMFVQKSEGVEIIQLYNGDCLEIMKDIPDKSVDLICTDIPYKISVENNFQTMKDRQGRNGIDFGEWDKDFDCNNLSMLPRLLKENGSILLFHSFEQYNDVKTVFEKCGLICKDRIIWEKTNPMPRNRGRRYISNCELASWYVPKKAKWTFNRQDEKYQKMIFRYPSESGGGFIRYHPTQKNLKLMEELIKIHSNKNDVILDCFMGSGSTGVACINTNRNFIGIEKDDKYFEIAKKRIEEAEKDKSYSLFEGAV